MHRRQPACRHDWSRIVTTLTAEGHSQRQIAAEVGVHESTVSRWAAGVQRPSVDVGVVLLSMAAPRPPISS